VLEHDPGSADGEWIWSLVLDNSSGAVAWNWGIVLELENGT
jgi:hypothetical protein